MGGSGFETMLMVLSCNVTVANVIITVDAVMWMQFAVAFGTCPVMAMMMGAVAEMRVDAVPWTRGLMPPASTSPPGVGGVVRVRRHASYAVRRTPNAFASRRYLSVSKQIQTCSTRVGVTASEQPGRVGCRHTLTTHARDRAATSAQVRSRYAGCRALHVHADASAAERPSAAMLSALKVP